MLILKEMQLKQFAILFFSFVSLCAFSQGNGYKQAVARKVFDQIVLAYGVSKSPPDFELKPKGIGRQQILMYYPGENPKIIMDEEVYDLCTKFGKDSLHAIASLIGHELAHHFEKHSWCSSFSYLLGEETEVVKTLKKASSEQRLSYEAQADEYGGFYGYLAGYKTYDITPKLLESIYSYYKMPERISGYPSKQSEN